MFGRSWKARRAWIGLLMVVAAALASAATYAVASATSPRNASASPASADLIKVHGRWTIKVVDGSGKVVTVRRFENALIYSGIPARIFGRKASVGLWQIFASPSTGNNSPCGGSSCFVQETTDASSPLTVSAPVDPGEFGPLTLDAHFTATQDGNVGRVQTSVQQCNYGTSVPCTPQGNSAWPFTATSITPVSIAAGQQVLIHVVISFS
jgi:hypothetical protein